MLPVFDSIIFFNEAFDIIQLHHVEKIGVGTFQPPDHGLRIIFIMTSLTKFLIFKHGANAFIGLVADLRVGKIVFRLAAHFYAHKGDIWQKLDDRAKPKKYVRSIEN